MRGEDLPFSYYEHKFLVADSNLPGVRDLLDALFGNSDPFPVGVVDSIYYDTVDRRSYFECLHGEPRKHKFRVRGYGDNRYAQFHLKQKRLAGVAKVKVPLVPFQLAEACGANPLERVKPVAGAEGRLSVCASMGALYGLLMPSVRVRYLRRRYRIGDDRVTLDSQIEVFALGHFPFVRDSCLLPWHVVEVKTMQPVPSLPLMGLLHLPATSFSKFFLGIQLLTGQEVQLA